MTTPFSASATFCAASFSVDVNFASATRIFSSRCRLPADAGMASLRGNRKLRAYPSATSTTWPRVPSFSTSSCRMICMVPCPSISIKRFAYVSFARELQLGRERQQRDILRPLDGDGEPALVTRAGARHAARQYLAALLNELAEYLGLFVVDKIRLVDAEAANFFLANKVALAALGRAAGTSLRAWSAGAA